MTMFAARRLPISALVLFVLLAVSSSFARVISYAPYSDRVSFPILQHRLNRHFALIEGPPTTGTSPMPIAPLPYGGIIGQLVLYDATGADEPRVIFPQDGTLTNFTVAALREDGRGVDTILIQTNYDFAKTNPQKKSILLLSTDSGATWKQVITDSDVIYQLPSWSIDAGGPFARSRYSPVRIGSTEFPFVVSGRTASIGGISPQYGVFAVRADGTVKVLASSFAAPPALAGSDAAGFRFIVRSPQSDTLLMVDTNGISREVGKLQGTNTSVEGWINADGSIVYADERSATIRLEVFVNGPGTIALEVFANGTRNVIAQASGSDPIALYAVPTFDYSGAWIVQRAVGKPTSLSLHTPSKGLVEQWNDITGPEVEAIHAGASGNTLLIQVHRSRPQIDQRIFKDPALAVWRIGDAAPRAYDELFMNEQPTKGFVHLDVDKIAGGDPFVFDSGAQPSVGRDLSPTVPVAGGGDVIQEWGVVRASLEQRLVLPGIGRTPGAYGSFWLSDVIFYNPLAVQQKVTVRFVPSGEVTIAAVINERTLALEPHEIRVIHDALKSLFDIQSGGGAFFITPESGVNVTSRTYTKSPLASRGGTYGFSMNAIDIFTAASPRFPVSFSGAFPGSEFRTNLILTDVSGRGSEAMLSATGLLGPMGNSGITISAAPGGQQQVNSISTMLGLVPGDIGALLVQPTRGEAIASVFAIDNRTNDPTYFPPDLPSPVMRTIPAIGHLDGANNSKFRSDLYLFNPSNQVRTVTLQEKAWDVPESPVTISLTLLPNEARVIRDVLFRLFGKTGIARLRYVSSGDATGVRVTSRTYTIDEGGGTYGFLMPPLNAFQTAAPGDSLEILGVTGGIEYRTNIGLVELSAFPGTAPASVRIEIIDDRGVTIDSFTTNVPSAGGMQLNDIFRARSLGDGPQAALIRVTPLAGMIGAYASVVDNGTNDSIYLAANLGAHQ